MYLRFFTVLILILPLTAGAYPITSYLEMVKVSSVSNAWKTLTLSNSYTNPVVACTYNLPSSANNEGSVRVQIIGSNIQIKVQRPLNSSAVTASDVYCTISEAGSYTSPIKYEAHTVSSTQTNKKSAWQLSKTVNVTSSKVQTYTKPVVTGQVMTYNNPNYVTFWSSNCSNKNTPPTNVGICVGKHTGESAVSSPTTETLGYFIAEEAEYTLANAYIKIALGGDSIRGVATSPPYNYSLPRSYSFATATLSAIDGGDGGWVVLYGASPISSQLSLAIDEDTVGDPDRNHTHEQVAYWVMEPILIPEISLQKTVLTYYDPFNITTNPKAIPGSVLEYIITASNSGGLAADNNSIKISDSVPANTKLCVSNTSNCKAPYFVNGTPSSGLSLASTSYTPPATADAEGADGNVTSFISSMSGAFLPKTGATAPNFSLKFRVIVK